MAVTPKGIYVPDVPGLINSVLEHLKPNGQARGALPYANLLLTSLMTLLRPVRIKKPEPGGPRVVYGAKQLGLGLPMVRLLRDTVFRGIREIENRDHQAAAETFEATLVLWQEQKPTPQALGGEPCRTEGRQLPSQDPKAGGSQ
jgi:hypothetical protein